MNRQMRWMPLACSTYFTFKAFLGIGSLNQKTDYITSIFKIASQLRFLRFQKGEYTFFSNVGTTETRLITTPEIKKKKWRIPFQFHVVPTYWFHQCAERNFRDWSHFRTSWTSWAVYSWPISRALDFHQGVHLVVGSEKSWDLGLLHKV